ncbi:type I secretion membrane fusion protein, HlyD family [Methylobacterium sp. 4-46]|uniref:HlyD family type I secretion periplasmic adaptor subunit n=2 Tax=Methylobacterium TaxID=407 RepID=UPI000152D4A9|nr:MULTISPECIES: HlyD family type I secretion periplasmic adaptor subunit [unclassified Methylobacterium]ACA18196.1 type I secretion membrane fusion protein, HlyD family [Methylobacterium sp. 4-46]
MTANPEPRPEGQAAPSPAPAARNRLPALPTARSLSPRRLTERVRAMAVNRENQEFLPAHLEILDTPPSPQATLFTWTICLMFAAALLWSFLAHLDIHAVASGRIQPSGRSKVVQPFETGKVLAVHVENGARVKEGDLLIELDPTEAEADLAARRGDLASLEAQIIRRQATVAAVETNQPATSPVAFPASIPPAVQARERAAMLAEIGQYVASRDALLAQIAEKDATQKRFATSIAARERLQAVLKERADMRETLVARQAGTRAAVIDAVQQVEQVAADLAYDRGQLIEAQAAAVSLQRRVEQLATETVAKQHQSVTEAAQKRDALRQDVVKAALKRERTRLTAPISGTVQQLAVTTLGQVVTAGQPLLVVVPSEGPIEVEAMVQNKDIGFVIPGQEAVVKIDAFPFTRYGSIEGKVARVSRDAVDDRDASGASDAVSMSRGQGLSPVSGTPKTQNLVFPVTIELSRATIEADGKTVPLTPGMTVTAEIRTGSRRVIDYVLSPVKETTATAGHER